MTNKEYFEKTFGYDGSVVAKVLPNEFGIGSCGYTDCRESCASRHFPRCPMWWDEEQDKESKELVCCKDCKYGRRLGYLYECDDGVMHEEDFYCKAGERKEINLQNISDRQ